MAASHLSESEKISGRNRASAQLWLWDSYNDGTNSVMDRLRMVSILAP
jgi:hypothetical protein